MATASTVYGAYAGAAIVGGTGGVIGSGDGALLGIPTGPIGMVIGAAGVGSLAGMGASVAGGIVGAHIGFYVGGAAGATAGFAATLFIGCVQEAIK